jgi:hypothetical protein
MSESTEVMADRVLDYITADRTLSVAGEYDATPGDAGTDAVLKSVVAALVAAGIVIDDTTQGA